MESTQKKPIVLAIDDSDDILLMLQLLLEEKYEIRTLSQPAKLKEMLAELTPDLFLLDYNMPELTGFDLMPIIRSFPKHKSTPVIYLTGVCSADFFTVATRLGACDYIMKPIDAEKLNDKIEKHIKA
ncbi:MAG: response regulator [Oscillospiraceae bacterium]|nr:response regulator [Oscillospiraceae bacterium]